MPTLNLGVVELAYDNRETKKQQGARIAKARKGRRRPKPAASGTAMETVDVARILEAKYHIIEQFYELHEEEIGEMFAEALGDTLADIMAGVAPPTINLHAAAESRLEEMFHDFLTNEELAQTATPGVPTKAALRGVSHRFKHPYARRARRPSFIDTGLYLQAFKAWMDP